MKEAKISYFQWCQLIIDYFTAISFKVVCFPKRLNIMIFLGFGVFAEVCLQKDDFLLQYRGKQFSVTVCSCICVIL